MSQQSLLEPFMPHLNAWDEWARSKGATTTSYAIFTAIIGAIIIASFQARAGLQASKRAHAARTRVPAPGFPDIEPLADFDWRNEEPIQSRPFKPKFFLTMALETLSPSELILMDKNYANRLDYRRRILKDNHDIVVGVNDDDKIRPAVRELYQFVMATYLPQRYPTMFRVHQALWESGAQLMTQNLVTSRMFPAIPPQDMSTLQLLEILGQSLDEEFLLLLPEETTSEKDEPKYVLEAYICVCASGFNPREKLGKRLADIHGPVPSYPEKLEGSMDRFFEKLEVGKYVKRLNWTVTTDAELFATGKDTTHAYEGTKVEEMKEIEVDKTYLRSERQTLHRLPGSKALVFAFKTHLYPIAQIKEEGLGDELAEAIDGLKNGNAPQMHFYKRGTVWGEAAKRYLRS